MESQLLVVVVIIIIIIGGGKLREPRKGVREGVRLGLKLGGDNQLFRRRHSSHNHSGDALIFSLEVR